MESETLDIEVETNVSAGTAISMHSVKNMLGDPKRDTLFEDQDETFSEKYGIELNNPIDGFGIELTEIQSRVVEGILRGFSETKYKGNSAPINVNQIVEDKFSGEIPDILKNIREVPVLKASQKEILEWSGINQNSIGATSRAVEAIEEIGMKQFCFVYSRLALDPNRQPYKNKSGQWVKEEVTCVDTLFTIKRVREDGKLPYYEIFPSAIFLDELDGYFLLIPNDWREELKKLTPNKKGSNYTAMFLLFLRYQYAQKIRANNEKKPFKIEWTPERLAQAIKIPESMIKKYKKRVRETLNAAYETAKILGYLEDYSVDGHLDILIMNERKYYHPSKESKKKNLRFSESMEDRNVTGAENIFSYFHKSRKILDQDHSVPEGTEREKQILVFLSILEGRSVDDVKSVIDWIFKSKYLSQQVTTPVQLLRRFEEISSAMSMEGNQVREEDQTSASSKEVFEYFHKIRKKLDKHHKLPIGEEKKRQIGIIESILEERSPVQVKLVIEWGVNSPFWTSKLMTPEGLSKNIGKIYPEMRVKEPWRVNIEAAEFAVTNFISKQRDASLKASEKSIDIYIGNKPVFVLGYREEDFIKRLKKALNEYGFSKLESDKS